MNEFVINSQKSVSDQKPQQKDQDLENDLKKDLVTEKNDKSEVKNNS